HGKGKPVNDDAAELLALHVNSLPERRRSEEDRVGSEAEFLEQRALGSIALQQHGIFQFPEQALVDVVHLAIAGEEDKSAPAGNLQQTTDAVCGLGSELRGAGIRQVRRNIKHGLSGVVEVRRQYALPCVLEAEASTYVFEAATHSQGGASQPHAFQGVEQACFQNGSDVNGRGLQEDILAR